MRKMTVEKLSWIAISAKLIQIVALDTHPVDFDGLPWGQLSKLGNFQKFPRTPAEQVLERSKGAEALIVNKVIISSNVIEHLPKLRYIGVTATGTNNIDLEAAKNRNIAVSNVPGYSTDSVAQLVFAYILHLHSRVAEHNELVQNAAWANSADFSFQQTPLIELKNKKIGIIGYGAIGKKTAEIAKAFGMEVLIAALPIRTYSESRPSLKEVLNQSDIISIHCPLTPETKHLINKEALSLMKETAILINTARGPIINETDLAEALKNKSIAHACLDVLSSEPPAANNPLLSTPNTIITPHIAWASREARKRLLSEVALNLEAFLKGEKRNRVV